MSSNRKSDVIVFAPHPGDEVLGCAGLIYNELKKGRKVKVVLITNGDADTDSFEMLHNSKPNQEDMIKYGLVRQKETISAMNFLGLKEDNILFLGYPDSYLPEILLSEIHSKKNPFKSGYTGLNSTAYENSYTKNAPYCKKSFESDVKGILEKYQPKRVYITHPKDIDGDHRSVGIAIKYGINNMKRNCSVFGYYISHVAKISSIKRIQKLALKGTRNLQELSLNGEMREIKERCIKRYKTQKSLIIPISIYFNRTEYFWRLM